MMAKLIRQHDQQVLIPQLEVARDFFSRGKGLLGRSSLGPEQGLWIHHCNSIHTFFMKFAIDCVFVNKKMAIVSICSEVVPQRLIWPQWGASSVFELPAGKARELNLRLGEVLHVGD